MAANRTNARLPFRSRRLDARHLASASQGRLTQRETSAALLGCRLAWHACIWLDFKKIKTSGQVDSNDSGHDDDRRVARAELMVGMVFVFSLERQVLSCQMARAFATPHHCKTKTNGLARTLAAGTTRLGRCVTGLQRCMAYTRGSVVVLVGKLRRDARCTSVTQFLKTLRVDTLWEREMGMCCCALVTKLTANCVSQILSRNARWVTSARTWTCLWRPLCSRGDRGLAWWPGLRCGVGSRVVAYGAVVVVQLRVDVKPPLYSCCVFFFVSLIF